MRYRIPRRLLGTGMLLVTLQGCQSLQFYHQAITGQARLLLAREPVDELIETSGDPALRERLELVGELLLFARESGLETGRAYRSYVETGKPFIVWNVFAAEPFELKLMTHCFPIAGCVSYRGYFDEADARDYALRLEADGLETYVAGVAAYSTLGWFDDPLLDTFLFREEDRLAALIFHELAHRMVYVPGDTRFNESVATALEQYLLRQWLAGRGELFLFDAFSESQARRQDVLELVDRVRDALRALYGSGVSRDAMADSKREIFARMREDYDALRRGWGQGSEFSGWMAGKMNNAKLETLADYNAWVPVLSVILEEKGVAGFRKSMRELADLTRQDREARLASLTTAGSR